MAAIPTEAERDWLMVGVVDRLQVSLREWAAADRADGGVADIDKVMDIYWGDPVILPATSYPSVTIQPSNNTDAGENTRSEARDLTVLVSILIDTRGYFNATSEEATGDRLLTILADSADTWLRRTVNRTLNDLPGVADVKVRSTRYDVQPRGVVLAKAAQITLVVRRSRQRHS
jgi:hypothetical protein